MNRPVYSFRPDLQQRDHRRAWEILKGVPKGQKNAFLVRAILQADNRETLRELIRESVQEVLRNGALTYQEAKEPDMDIPDQMLSFLENL